MFPLIHLFPSANVEPCLMVEFPLMHLNNDDMMSVLNYKIYHLTFGCFFKNTPSLSKIVILFINIHKCFKNTFLE